MSHPGPDALYRDSMALGASETPVTFTMPQPYVLSGTKWGPSQTLGTSGGTVTWSITAAGLTNASGSNFFFQGNTVALSTFLMFDYTTVLNQAFSAWSSVANINFVQIADGGGNIGVGSSADIRLTGGYIDGDADIVGYAFGPPFNGSSQGSAVAGDVVFDSGEVAFWNPNIFLAVAMHEIGHAIGLDHSAVLGSVMYPTVNASLSAPQADDIAGIRQIYGPANAPGVGSISIDDVSIVEGNAGTRTATFTVTRAGGTGAFSFSYATANETAQSGSDYTASNGTLSFGANSNTQTITVTILGDTNVEANETFFVNLSGGTNGVVIADNQGRGTITDDDALTSTDDFADRLTDGTAPLGITTVGVSTTGRIETVGDRDWFRVQLNAGGTYVINLQSRPDAAGALGDPYLRIYNSAGTLLSENDDRANGIFDSQLTYTANTAGSYYVEAGAYNDTGTGAYTVSVTAGGGTVTHKTAVEYSAAYGRITQNNSLTTTQANALAAADLGDASGNSFNIWVADIADDTAVVNSTGAVLQVWDVVTGAPPSGADLAGQVNSIESLTAAFGSVSIGYKGMGASLANSFAFNGSFETVWNQNTNTVAGQQAFVTAAYNAVFGRAPTASELSNNVTVFEIVASFYDRSPVAEPTTDARAKGEFLADYIKQANDFSSGPGADLAVYTWMLSALAALGNNTALPPAPAMVDESPVPLVGLDWQDQTAAAGFA